MYIAYAATADQTITNTTTETTLFGTGVGTLTFPANFWTVGRIVRINISGDIADTGNPTAQVRVKLGATTVSDSTATTLAGLSGTEEWDCKVTLVCESIGASGTIETNIMFEYETTTGSSPVRRFDIAGTNTVYDTTASGAVDVTFQWGTASASNTLVSQISTVEVLT